MSFLNFIIGLFVGILMSTIPNCDNPPSMMSVTEISITKKDEWKYSLYSSPFGGAGIFYIKGSPNQFNIGDTIYFTNINPNIHQQTTICQ